MQKHLQKEITLAAQHSNLCPKCGSELHVSWCARCFGTGRSGKHECKTCGGTGTTTACPNVRSHKLNLFAWLFYTTGATSPTELRKNEEIKRVH
jgi:hypothetical protein